MFEIILEEEWGGSRRVCFTPECLREEMQPWLATPEEIEEERRRRRRLRQVTGKEHHDVGGKAKTNG